MRRGFSLIELLVVIAVAAVLLSILLPALSGAREASRRGKCLANLRTIATVTSDYLHTYRALPTVDDMPEDVAGLRCPSAHEPDEGGYPYPVSFGTGMGMGASPTTFFGRVQSVSPSTVSVVYCYRHVRTLNGYLDGHAK